MSLAVVSTREELDLGRIHSQECERCRREQPFRLRLLYSYDSFLFVFGHSWLQIYVVVCDVCGTRYRIPRRTAWKLGRLNRHPLPFLSRFGCLLITLVLPLFFMGLSFLKK